MATGVIDKHRIKKQTTGIVRNNATQSMLFEQSAISVSNCFCSVLTLIVLVLVMELLSLRALSVIYHDDCRLRGA